MPATAPPARPAVTAPPGATRRAARWTCVYREMIKFGVVGAVAFVVDLGLSNLLWHTVLSDTSR